MAALHTSRPVSQGVQEFARTHDSNPGVFLEREQIWIAGYHEIRTRG
jgi:hypothetical protein